MVNNLGLRGQLGIDRNEKIFVAILNTVPGVVKNRRIGPLKEARKFDCSAPHGVDIRIGLHDHLKAQIGQGLCDGARVVHRVSEWLTRVAIVADNERHAIIVGPCRLGECGTGEDNGEKASV